MLKYTGIANGASAAAGMVLAKLPLDPNHWTVLSVVSAMAGAWAAYNASLALFAALAALAFVCDFFDGAVARARKKESRKGAFLDGVSDRLVEAAIIAGLYFIGIPDFVLPSMVWLFLLLVFGTFMTSFVKAYSQHTGVLDHKQARSLPGILERGERVGLLFMAIVAIPINASLAGGIVALVAVLSFVTFAQRVAHVMKS
ncbi:CDP-alcohol phosphatidyltransferase family protein [Candidatus Parvarchaeota archaeon]|nr:CDP-alcohol phosphatidyltransferase family protein [Candidatus Parvarchaeota archaeon]